MRTPSSRDWPVRQSRSLGQLLRRVRRATPDESDEAFAEFPEVNVVRLLTHGEPGSDRELFPADSSDAQRRGFVYSPPPTSKKRVYLISGKSEGDLVETVRKFAELDDVTPSGFLFTLE